jgi:hypothetical protein
MTDLSVRIREEDLLNNNGKVEEDQNEPAVAMPRRKYPWAILVIIILFVVIPFISWYGTWFGRPLSDAKMEEYLHDRNKPRNVQHALSQVANRILDGDQSVKKFYPDVVAASENPQSEVRMTCAWTMGQDNTYQDFHKALLKLLEDTSPGVRHNAALALVRFADASARKELVAMLKPYSIRAPADGTIELTVKEQNVAVAANAPLARIKQSGGNSTEIQAPEAGHVSSVVVSDGASVEAGRELMSISPSAEQVWEALRALYIVGEPEDLPAVQRYTGPVPAMPDRIQKQAASTSEAIRERAGKS